jgi:hypothetical protein
MRSVWCCMRGMAALAVVFGCVAPDQIFVKFQAPGRLSGGLYSDGQTLEFSSTSTAPLLADVTLQTTALRFDTHFDYDNAQVTLDGHGSALDWATHAMLLDAVTGRAESVGADLASLPLEEQALYASLVMWEQSGGIAVDQLAIPIERRTRAAPGLEARGLEAQPTLVRDGTADDARSGEAIPCVTPGASYALFDEPTTAVAGAALLPRMLTADLADCDGLCGLGCAQLTPQPMWTLHCLELDACCKATDSPDCWAPSGECSVEYQRALGDFVRGLDPKGEYCPASAEALPALAPG